MEVLQKAGAKAKDLLEEAGIDKYKVQMFPLDD